MVSPTKLLLHCDGADAATTFADSSQSAHVVTAHGAAQLDTAQKEFGTASGYFTSANDYLSLDSATDFTFGTGDFTIETWLRRETTAVPVVLIDFRSGSDHMPPYVYYDAGSLRYYCNGADRITATATLAVGTWHHVAVARAGSNTRMFLDGVQVGSTYVAADNLTCNSSGPIIGGALAVALLPETAAWVAAVVAAGGTVSSGVQALIDAYIAGLKADGIWAKADRIILHCLENTQSALVDVVHNVVGTTYNSPLFTANRGFTGDGATTYIDPYFSPDPDGVNFTGSAACGGVWDLTVLSATGGVAIGGIYYGIYPLDLTTNYGGSAYFRIQGSGGVSAPYPGAGLYLMNRSDASSTQFYYNGISIVSSTADGAWGNVPLKIFIMARNDGNNNAYVNCNEQIAGTFLLGTLTATEHLNFYNRTHAVLTAVGAAMSRSSPRAPELMILLAPDEADAVRGFSSLTPLAALKPKELRDGNFILPLAVLDDPAHAEHADFLRTLPTVDPREYMGMLLEDALGTIRPT